MIFGFPLQLDVNLIQVFAYQSSKSFSIYASVSIHFIKVRFLQDTPSENAVISHILEMCDE